MNDIQEYLEYIEDAIDLCDKLNDWKYKNMNQTVINYKDIGENSEIIRKAKDSYGCIIAILEIQREKNGR